MSAIRDFAQHVKSLSAAKGPKADDAVGDDPKKGAQCRIAVFNNTDVKLVLRATLGPKGKVSVGAGQEIRPNKGIEFDATDDEAIDFSITWNANKEGATPATWFTTFKFKPVNDSEGKGEHESFMSKDDDDRYSPGKTFFRGRRFEFTLNLQGAPPPPPPPIAGTILSTVLVENRSSKALVRVRNEMPQGDEATPSPGKLAPGGSFTLVAGGTKGPITGIQTWRVEDEKAEVWSFTWHMDLPAANQQADTPTSADSQALDKRFVAVKPDFGKGPKATFKFRLEDSSTPPPPPPAQDVNVSCIITVTNNTQSVLNLLKPNNERGDFMTFPTATLKPGDSTNFAYVQTPKETEEAKKGCKGSLSWQVGTPGVAVWQCAWENLVGEKNSAPTTIDPTSAGFQPLGLPGQGDENVPFSFILQGGGGPIPPPPPPPPPTPEPEFKPPTEEKQPTLRQGDKSADGWVEYLQVRLNRRLNPSPNLKEDGDFGPATYRAVIAYQTQEKLQVDGVVGNQTWASLRLADPEAVGTDKRKPHTFVEKGIKARWLSEGGLAVFRTSANEMELAVVSVGDDTKLEGQTVNVFVTAPGSKRKGVVAKIGPPLHTTQTGQGDIHQVLLSNFTNAFPSTPPGAPVKTYVIEGYFDQALGGDFWTSTRDEIVVKP